jgi:hypothetical protein
VESCLEKKKLNFSVPRLVGDATSKIEGTGNKESGWA